MNNDIKDTLKKNKITEWGLYIILMLLLAYIVLVFKGYFKPWEYSFLFQKIKERGIYLQKKQLESAPVIPDWPKPASPFL